MRIIALSALAEAQPLNLLAFEPLLELQRGLGLLGYGVRDLDGQFGPRTRNAWAEFEADCGATPDGNVSPVAVGELCRQVALLEDAGDPDFSTRDGTIAAIIAACGRHRLTLPQQIAYVLATVEHETNRSFMPVREAYYLGEPRAETYRRSLRYYPYYGRGYVQLTWKDNFSSYGKLLECDLASEPDLAMDPAIALFVLIHGFKSGAFTGRKLTEFVNERGCDYVNARRCINGLDRAEDIATLARGFEARL
ncbi:peptidoglycan-binding domain-containing protein [Roseomonas sp. 18066]|uniref:peptidoglycan-binding domain-containing protein n=1 Tax=Roseomonas sp. 18066 TaxID=2681412 RepID=UPI0013586A5B|nr:peptidoglycan-binding domain-containing protein [Roseomonas sp. 18066]